MHFRAPIYLLIRRPCRSFVYIIFSSSTTMTDVHVDAFDDPEKGPSTLESELPTLEQIGQRGECVIDAKLDDASTRQLKTTEDGRTILLPQPSDDPDDPLNWSQMKKMTILVVVSCTGKYYYSGPS